MTDEDRGAETAPLRSLYRVVLSCNSVPRHAGPQAAIAITEEFARRPWHSSVVCAWDGNALVLHAENDFDPEGLALMDEFSDAISACIAEGFDGDIRVLSTTRV
jgi:hypothetical protein